MAKYRRPDWFTTNVFNRLGALVAKLGIDVGGTHVLTVPGRKTGEPRSTPVAVLEHDRESYLVAPRGNTMWARNLRAAGGGELRKGRRNRRFTATEIPEGERAPIIRDYVKQWRSTRSFFELDPDDSDEKFAAAAGDHPVFRIEFES